jgi:hypothetical protein
MPPGGYQATPGLSTASGFAPADMGMIGATAPIDMFKWATQRQQAMIRQRNLRNTFGGGGAVLHTLPNGHSIGWLPDSHPSVSHVLLSPQGAPILYGRNPVDLIKRGFFKDEIPGLISSLPQSARGSEPTR